MEGREGKRERQTTFVVHSSLFGSIALIRTQLRANSEANASANQLKLP